MALGVFSLNRVFDNTKHYHVLKWIECRNFT